MHIADYALEGAKAPLAVRIETFLSCVVVPSRGKKLPIPGARDFTLLFYVRAPMALTSDSPTCQITCHPYLPPDNADINKQTAQTVRRFFFF